MKFDFCVGNPPYQGNTIGDNKSFAPPIYHYFMDAAEKISDKVELITPARFLFNAGATPKAWNKRKLNDEHFKVLQYNAKSSTVFPLTDIKSGVTITYWNATEKFEKVETFTAYNELNEIKKKITDNNPRSLSEIAVSAYAFHFTENLYLTFPELKEKSSKGHEYDLKSNVFNYLSDIFFDIKPNDGFEYVQVIGRQNNERIYKYIRKDFLTNSANFMTYKVFIAGASGSGAIGETLSTPVIGIPVIGTPAMGTTESFMSIGYFESYQEAECAMKYIKTKFARVLLSILKATQNITPEKWRYVPLQDFTSDSDIDWNQSIANIDRQLYAKYGLSQNEIDFIETHIKPKE